MLIQELMKFTYIPSSEGRKKLPEILKDVDDTGAVYVITIHGKSKAAIVDLDLLEEFIENAEYGISARELLKRSKEKTISLKEFKKEFNV